MADVIREGREMDGLDKRVSRRQCLVMTAAVTAAIMTDHTSLRAEDRRPLRLAISTETLAGANINDARAAYLVWLREVAHLYPVQVAKAVPEVFLPSRELTRDVRQGSLDCYGVTAPELEKLADLTDPDSLVLQDYLADGMQYVLLVHRNSSLKKLTDLRGTHIVFHLHRDMVLLPAWLGTMLASQGFSQPEHFFASRTNNDKINQVVLPVFFRRIDAACLARRSWDTAVELNPQLGRDLIALATSPRIIPIGFGFRRNTSPESRQALITSIQNVSSYTAGQQIVDLYQSRAFVVRPLSAMNATFDMLRQFERVSGLAAESRGGQD